MSLPENLANAYSSSLESTSGHGFLAKTQDGSYVQFKDRTEAKKQNAKVVSAAKVLKLLAKDMSTLGQLDESQKKNLKTAVDHLALKNINNESSKGLKQKIRNLFKRICCKLRDKNYRAIMHALENKSGEANAITSPKVKQIKTTTRELDGSVSTEPSVKAPAVKADFTNLFSSTTGVEKKDETPILDFEGLVLSSSKSLEKVGDFKADFDKMFSSSKNPPFIFDKSKLEEYGITLKDLQLIRDFQDSTIPDKVKLKFQTGYPITTCGQVKEILTVTTSSSEVLSGSLSMLQKELFDQKKQSFCVMDMAEDISKTTFVAPDGTILDLKDYKRNPQKAVYINYNHGHLNLIKLDPSKKQVLFYDSMGGADVAPSKYNKQRLDALAKELGWKWVVEDGPKQSNGTDCGLFCYEKARRFCKGLDEKEFKAQDIAYVRLEAVSSYLKSSRFLDKEKTKWFETRLKASAQIYYLNRTIPPAKVQLLKECLEGEREPKGITKAELKALIDDRTIPPSLIPKIQDHIDELKGKIEGRVDLLKRIPSREMIDGIPDIAKKEELLLGALKDLYNQCYNAGYQQKGKELKDEFCVMLALLFVN